MAESRFDFFSSGCVVTWDGGKRREIPREQQKTERRRVQDEVHFNRRGCGMSYRSDFQKGCEEIGFLDPKSISAVYAHMKEDNEDYILLEQLSPVIRT